MSQRMVGYLLSPQQKNLWKQGQEQRPYYTTCELLIEGNIDNRMMRRAVEKVAARHEILRTRYEPEDLLGTALQVVDEDVTLAWQEEDLTALGADEQEVRIAAIYGQAVERKRQGEGGLFVSLIGIGADRSVMQIALDSLSADSRTMRNLIEEIGASYAACLNGKESSDEPVQYAQFSEWQAELLNSEDAEEGKQYWRKHPGFVLSAPSLPFEALPVAESPSQFHTYDIGLDTDALERADAIAEKYKTTTDIVLLACWQTLLWRHIGQPDITVGSIFDGRKFEELQTALGLLSKCLPVHLPIGGELRFGELLRPLHQSAHEACKWQEYFDWDDVATAGANGHSTTDFIPYCFEYEQWPSPARINNLSFTLRKSYSCINRFKIKLNCRRAGSALTAWIYFDPRLFSDTQIKWLAAQYASLLTSATSDPEKMLGELDMLGEPERRELLDEFNRTAAVYQADLADLNVRELFERQAERTPDRAAVISGAEWVSYRELNTRANQMGHYLRRLGVGPDVVVGICLRRSVEMVVGLLGILKAGGAYMPMEPSYPTERLRYMVEDARARVILTEHGLAETLPTCGATRVCVDYDRKEIEREDKTNPDVVIDGGNLVYAIYTSGSTGKPKAVMVEHRGLANYVNWSVKAYRVEEGAGAPVHSPLGFDLTVTSLYPLLVTGQSVWLAPEQKGIEALVESLRGVRDYTLLKITPAHLDALRLMMRAEEVAGASRLFVIGGEALKDESLEYWRVNAPGTRLVNEYGPTETVVGCCVFDATSGGEIAEEMVGEREGAGDRRHRRVAVPVGRPIANMQMYVADEKMRMAPSGVAGELFIGGVGVARGYLNRPDLTAEKFLPNSWGGETGARVYRTGDLGMRLGDQGIEFLGRIDDQVKVRGYRIEPAEIETVLEGHDLVKQCKVVAYQEGGDEKRLVAYVVCEEGSATTIEILSGYLKERLPEHMVPSRFVMLDFLPLTPNGKVDVRALPAPTDAGRQADYVAPRSPVEEALAEMWAEVLKLERVGVHDDFFLLGGHSLLVIQVTARLRETFQMELEPSALFEATTVAKLAEAMVAREPKPGQTEKIALILRELSVMTDEDAGAALAAKGRSAAEGVDRRFGQ